MRAIPYIVQKEFLQIFRHRIMLPLIFVMPVLQLLVLSFAADYEVDNLRLHINDLDRSQASRQLVGHFQASPHFTLTGNGAGGAGQIHRGEADLLLEIPLGFNRSLAKGNRAEVQVAADAINGVQAGLAQAYANAIVQSFSRQFSGPTRGLLSIETANWYNPGQDYQTFMVPGILVILVTLVGMFLSGMNIVKEKEIGTIEQINVSPIGKGAFIVGKLLPFWLIGMAELSIGLIAGRLVFGLPLAGSLAIIFVFAGLYLFVVLGFGLLISTFTETQQQAMFLAWFFLIIFILMSGLFTPIESMPPWAQALTKGNPVAYFVDVMRLVLLKGSGWQDVQPHFGVMAVYAGAVNTLAVLNYQKTN
ncbi:ABC transporter permease [Phaeodactylibacter luteus]|uniref:ABC transporter permease n=1 Tax=Phaeodactylibacter luteus TaxID=1564516 RepID=A0A5C6RPB2_9BACT|nr:ABC transporter permease [Phaeodactylibacter luteus]TXB64168.1 ABC transporter permease [Phaeodactylibacter luteus]